MMDYLFVRHFSSPLYYVVALILFAMSMICLFAAMTQTLFALFFYALFISAFAATVRAIVRGDEAGVRVDDKTISWWCTGTNACTESIELTMIQGIIFKNFDHESIRFFLCNGVQKVCDETFFDSGQEVLKAVGDRCPEVTVTIEGMTARR